MNREKLAEELDREIDTLMSAPLHGTAPDSLLQIAAELRTVPRQDFRASLRAELVEFAESLQQGTVPENAGDSSHLFGQEAVPSFSTRQFAVLPADPRSLLVSFLSHATVVALIVSGVWVGHVTLVENRPTSSELTYTPLSSGDTGGGSGGDRSRVLASHGTPPKFAEEQFAAPAIVVPNERPKLQSEVTVVGPPELKLPQSKQLGDLFSSNSVIPSNGTGGPSGIGNNFGTGVGPGGGAGVGAGRDTGFGVAIFHLGKGVSAPHVLYNPDPEYSDEARRVKFQGNVVLALIVDPTGHVRDIRVARSLGLGLDEKAIDAVQKWRFAPGMKDGHPVAVQVNVEVNFRLY